MSIIIALYGYLDTTSYNFMSYNNFVQMPAILTCLQVANG